MTLENWIIFMTIWIAASIPLGPNALNCISTSATYGFVKSLWSVVGIFIAASIYMVLAISGIAAFITANPALFDVLRWLGAAYLVWMGVSMFRKEADVDIDIAPLDRSPCQLVVRGILISLSNPKAIFAWLSIFSQFADATVPLGPQLAVLAPSALSVTLLVYIGYCALGLGVNKVFSGSRKRWFDRVTGSVYLTFAYFLISSDLRKT